MGGGRDFTTGQSVYVRRNGVYYRRDGKEVKHKNKPEERNEQSLIDSPLMPDRMKRVFQKLVQSKKDGKMSQSVQERYNSTLDVLERLEKQRNDGNELEKFANLSENEMADRLQKSKNKSMNDLPSQLQTGGESDVQKLVYDLGLNGKPLKVSPEDFQTLLENGIYKQSDILTRSFNNIDAFQEWQDGDLNYISGRFGGSWYGEGQYFAFNGGHNTGYGSNSVNAFFRPDAKILRYENLAETWRSLPEKVRNEIGNPFQNESMVALAAGYQAIYDKGAQYVCVIDRSALIIEDRIFTD